MFRPRTSAVEAPSGTLTVTDLGGRWRAEYRGRVVEGRYISEVVSKAVRARPDSWLVLSLVLAVSGGS